MEYIYGHVHTTMPFGQIAAVIALIAAMSIILLWYELKNTPESIERPYSRELPEGWFSNLADMIVRNAQKKEISPKSYEFYVWNHNGFELEAFFDWQDFYDGIEAFDLPIPMSATITIFKKGILYRKEMLIAILNRNDYRMIGYDNYEEEYKERTAKRIEVRVREREVPT